MADEPCEVLGYVADLQDGRVEQRGTIGFLEAIQRLADQTQQFLTAIGR